MTVEYSKGENWWKDLYDDKLAEILLVRENPDELKTTLSFLIEKLSLSSGIRVFDQCCGIGSLGIPLAQAGMEVIGVDQCESYIHRARHEAAEANLHANFLVGDAFEFVTEIPCMAAFNWWTSFGYSPDDAVNIKMLHCAFNALGPGGRFAIDYFNFPGVLRTFYPEVITRRDTPQGEMVLSRKTEIDLKSAMIHKLWTYYMPDGGCMSRPSSVRFYMPHELTKLLATCGFEEIKLFGSVQGEPLGLDSPRCIAVARKPG